MKKKRIVICLIVALMVVIALYVGVQRTHTYTLKGGAEPTFKSEEVQPLFGTVKVSGDSDTDVVFTDVETGETYTIGYITPGVTEKIKLQKGKWYTVRGAGNLTMRPVNLRIE